jgi:F0F1-type ATP synthase assembly protein I
VFGLAGVFASCGILFTTSVGGWLYDVLSKGSPFFLIGFVNLAIMAFGIYLLRTRSNA